MKKIITFLSILISVLVLNSCANLTSGSGYVTLTMPGIPKADRAAYTLDQLEYKVSITNQATTVAEEQTATAGEKVTLELDPGTYTIAIEASAKKEDGTSKLVYSGSVSDVTVTAGQTTQASISLTGYVTITFDANGGTGTMDAVTVKKGTVQTLPECSFKPTGKYHFAGWAATKDAKETLKAKAEYKVDADITLYAIWEANPKAEKVEFSAAAGTILYGTKVTLTTKTKGAKIYYTTDGTDPAKAEKKVEYKEPIVITKAMTIKAYAESDENSASDVSSVEYKLATGKPGFDVVISEVNNGDLVLESSNPSGNEINLIVKSLSEKEIVSYSWLINGAVAENETKTDDSDPENPTTVDVIIVNNNQLYIKKGMDYLSSLSKYNFTFGGGKNLITCIVETADGEIFDISYTFTMGS